MPRLDDQAELSKPAVVPIDRDRFTRHMLMYGVDPLVQEAALNAVATIERLDTEQISHHLELRRDELITASGIETRAKATRRGFLTVENPASPEEQAFVDRCGAMKSNNAAEFGTLIPPDGDVIAQLNDKLIFRPPAKGGDNFECSVIGDLSLVASKVDLLLTDAGIEDQHLRDVTAVAVTRRVAAVVRALDSDSASVIVTCRIRRGSGDAELLPHYDGTFDPRHQGTQELEFKAVSVLTGPTTKVWKEGDYDRAKARAACAYPSSLPPNERENLLAESIKGSHPQSLGQGELLVFKSGDPAQATLHTIPAFPSYMNRLIVQINPLPFGSIGQVWWNDQSARVARALDQLNRS